MAVIELRDVSFTYDGERDALSHVSLTVEPTWSCSAATAAASPRSCAA